MTITLLKLFWSFFQVGLLSIGGGYAAMPLIQEQVVQRNGWLTLAEFTDLITIAEMTPGPITINSSTFVGIRIAGMPGAIVATLGCILPSCVIVSLLAHFYFKYQNLLMIQGILKSLCPTVVALIASAGLSILLLCLWGEDSISVSLLQKINPVSLVLFVSAFVWLRRKKPSPILVMMVTGFFGGAVYLMFPNLG